MSLETFPFSSIDKITCEEKENAISTLEGGEVIFLPHFPFPIMDGEYTFFSPEVVHPSMKNISYNSLTDKLGKSACNARDIPQLSRMLKRYSQMSRELMEALFPHYKKSLRQGRTSFRPVEAQGRALSYKKDDTLLHVDAFPATPLQGERILRLFTNVNPYGKARVWKIGEPFPQVVEKIAPRVQPPLPGTIELLEFFKITKSRRSLYDHYMLKIHDTMKGDKNYQSSADQKEVHFPPQSSWIVFSDQVSHAALSGQFLFEQTFYLPVSGQKYPERSPLRILERFYGKRLVTA